MVLSGRNKSSSLHSAGAARGLLRVLNRRNAERALWFCLCTISLFISLELSAFEHFDSTQGKFDIVKELSTKKEVKQYSLEEASEQKVNFFWSLMAAQTVTLVILVTVSLLVCLRELSIFAQSFFALHSGRSPPRLPSSKFQVVC